MFGGTRGKFNAMDLLSDREERQRMRGGMGRRRGLGGGRSSGLSSRGGRDPVIQDFGSVRDWNARKAGGGRTGGNTLGDDTNNRYDDRGMGGPAPFPGGTYILC